MQFAAFTCLCLLQQAPTPSSEAQDRAAKTLHEIFKADYAKRGKAERVALAKRLIETASELEKETDMRFVALNEARDLAVRGGDVKVAFSAIDRLTSLYVVDALALRIDALKNTRTILRSPSDARALSERWNRLADQAIREERFTEASACLAKASTAARSSRDRSLIARLKERAKSVADMKEDHRKWTAAAQKLKTNPDDPAALLAAGRYLCLVRDDWKQGIPMLSRGSDPKIREAARKDLAEPSTAAAQVEAGDAWWKLDRFSKRSATWYAKALPGLAGLTRLRVQKRLSGIAGAAPVAVSGAMIEDFESGLGRLRPHCSSCRVRIEESTDAKEGRKAARLTLSADGDRNPRFKLALRKPPPPGTRGIAFWARSEGERVTLRLYLRQGSSSSSPDRVNHSLMAPLGPESKLFSVPFEKMDPWSPTRPIPPLDVSKIHAIDVGHAKKGSDAVYLIDGLRWVTKP